MKRVWRRTIDEFGEIPEPHAHRKKMQLAATTSIDLAKAVESLNKAYAKFGEDLKKSAAALEKFAKELEELEQSRM